MPDLNSKINFIKEKLNLAINGNHDSYEECKLVNIYISDYQDNYDAFKRDYGLSPYFQNADLLIQYISSVSESCEDLDFNEKFKKFPHISDFYSTQIASNIEANTQIQKYHNVRTGHGYAAEDANTLNDYLSGKDVNKTGLNNELNGPDRIVDGVKIQTKYYQDAQSTVNSAFDSNGFRYPGQQIEVPADQYDQAVDIMKEKIRDGLVTDIDGKVIKNENEAENLIKKGDVTYEQAKNIAKAGNVDSIIFDVKNNLITSSCILGISGCISLAISIWNGGDLKSSLKNSIKSALCAGVSSLLIGVVSSQILRTKVAASSLSFVRSGVKLVSKTSLGKSIIESVARTSLGKAVYGAPAINHVSKLLRSNIVTGIITTTITSAPDFYRAAIAKSISWGQLCKNLFVNASGVAGGSGGWVVGAAAGAAIGSAIPVVGTGVGGVVGGLLGAVGLGITASKIAKNIADEFKRDDAELMVEIIQEEAETISFNNILNAREMNQFINGLQSKITHDFLIEMFKSGNTDVKRRKFARRELQQICDSIIAKREHIHIPENEVIIDMAIKTAEKELLDAYDKDKMKQYSEIDPRYKYYKIKLDIRDYMFKLKDKTHSEICQEIGAVLLSSGVLIALSVFLYSYFPKVTIGLIVLILIGWYHEYK